MEASLAPFKLISWFIFRHVRKFSESDY